MKLQPKQLAIFNKLHEAKSKGVLEVDVFPDLETSNNAAKIKSVMNKILGAGSVYTENGRWFLLSIHWDMTPLEFRDLMIFQELNRTRMIVLWSIGLAIFLALLLGLFVGYNYEFYEL